MKNSYTIAAAIVAIIIIIGGIFAYTSLSQLGPQASPSPSPTGSPTSTPASTISPTGTLGSTTLNGAGATFPAPFLNATILTYTSQVRTNLKINYQPVGSGQGISSLTTKTVDFAASDAPLTDSQRTAAPNALHIPETIGAVTIAYNLPGIASGVHLTGNIIAQIYLGTIANWKDTAIQSINTNITLPDHAITAVHRSDSSGTTNIFTKYLANVSSTWASQIGSGTSVQWSGGIGASGNANVASTINQTQYSIGYVELSYALQNGMNVASVQNPAGNYIQPSLSSTTIAVQSGASQGLPSGNESWTSVSFLNTADPQSYPIVSFTYLLVYQELNVVKGMDQNKATQLVQYIWWVIHDGQQLAPNLQYAQLPLNVVQIDEATIQSITFNGQHLPTS
jgi:phosphate transport system substrate-binding protein